MDIQFLEGVKAIVERYQKNCQAQGDKIRQVLEPFKNPSYANRFNADGLRETIAGEIRQIREDWHNQDIQYNQELKALIEGAKQMILPSPGSQKKPDDYALRINNALQFLQIEGGEITDESAYVILKDFIEDYENMRLFSKVVMKHIKARRPLTTLHAFPKTFGKLTEMEEILNVFEQLEAQAERVFLHKRPQTDVYISINGQTFGVPSDGYGEAEAEQNVIAYAKSIEEMAERIA